MSALRCILVGGGAVGARILAQSRLSIRFGLVGIIIYQDSLDGVEDGVRRVGRERGLGRAFHPI